MSKLTQFRKTVKEGATVSIDWDGPTKAVVRNMNEKTVLVYASSRPKGEQFLEMTREEFDKSAKLAESDEGKGWFVVQDGKAVEGPFEFQNDAETFVDEHAAGGSVQYGVKNPDNTVTSVALEGENMDYGFALGKNGWYVICPEGKICSPQFDSQSDAQTYADEHEPEGTAVQLTF